jgi:hypothetical protein
MKGFFKFIFIVIGVVFGLKILSNVFVDKGMAGQCVASDVLGQFKSYENSCDYSINTQVCAQYILGSMSCRPGTVGPGGHIITVASENAGILIGVLSPVNLSIAACKTTHSPEFTEGTDKYTCRKIE